MFKKSFLILILIFCFIPSLVLGASPQEQEFFIYSKYDISSRDKITAHLFKPTNKINFYIDEAWLKNYDYDFNHLNSLLYQTATDFEYNVYPKLTDVYGVPSKWQDSQWRLNVVFHSLKQNYKGYTRKEDLYSKSFSPNSNSQDVVFLSASILKESPSRLAGYLAHEFTHLLSLHLKSAYNMEDEIWLEELRAELSETMTQDLANNFEGSILKGRLEDFILATNFSLLNWQGDDRDYAVVNVLGQYLREKYGNNILRDSLNSPFKGRESIEYALKKNGYEVTFEEIIKNWMVASVLNDCSADRLYCFESPYLNKIQKEQGDTYFIPTKVESQMIGTDYLKGLSGKWLKIVGGMNNLDIKFTLDERSPIYNISYVILKTDGTKQLGFLNFISSTTSNLFISNNKGTAGIIFLPYLSDDSENAHSYTFEINSYDYNAQREEEIIQALLKRIEELKRQVALLEVRLAMQKTYQSNFNCAVFSRDLYYGMNSNDVKCLQQFLANLGPEIYPEGLITGYYGPLTQAAVKRYQTFKGIITTGYFGPLTRAKANQEL